MAVLRGSPLALLLVLGLGATVLMRAVERPLFHPRRPVTPWIAVAVCRGALLCLGLRVRVEGAPITRRGMIVANHVSWLDVFVLNSQGPMVFVAKSEVAGWPGIGWLARATGTLFVRRDARAQAGRQAQAVADRLGSGERLALFPEGTSTDGRRVLPFRAPLLAGPMAPGAPHGLCVQPATISYFPPPDRDPRLYAWFGDSDFGPHLLAVLAQRRGGTVKLVVHEPIPVAGRDRKSLAAEAEARVRAAL